jgi:hypothetical protein
MIKSISDTINSFHYQHVRQDLISLTLRFLKSHTILSDLNVTIEPGFVTI